MWKRPYTVPRSGYFLLGQFGPCSRRKLGLVFATGVFFAIVFVPYNSVIAQSRAVHNHGDHRAFRDAAVLRSESRRPAMEARRFNARVKAEATRFEAQTKRLARIPPVFFHQSHDEGHFNSCQ